MRPLAVLKRLRGDFPAAPAARRPAAAVSRALASPPSPPPLHHSRLGKRPASEPGEAPNYESLQRNFRAARTFPKCRARELGEFRLFGTGGKIRLASNPSLGKMEARRPLEGVDWLSGAGLRRRRGGGDSPSVMRTECSPSPCSSFACPPPPHRAQGPGQGDNRGKGCRRKRGPAEARAEGSEGQAAHGVGLFIERVRVWGWGKDLHLGAGLGELDDGVLADGRHLLLELLPLLGGRASEEGGEGAGSEILGLDLAPGGRRKGGKERGREGGRRGGEGWAPRSRPCRARGRSRARCGA